MTTPSSRVTMIGGEYPSSQSLKTEPPSGFYETDILWVGPFL